MQYEFIVEYGSRRGAPPWWGHITVWAEDERDARSIGLRMAARHKTDIVRFDIVREVNRLAPRKTPPCSKCGGQLGNHTSDCGNNPKNWPQGPTPKPGGDPPKK